MCTAAHDGNGFVDIVFIGNDWIAERCSNYPIQFARCKCSASVSSIWGWGDKCAKKNVKLILLECDVIAARVAKVPKVHLLTKEL